MRTLLLLLATLAALCLYAQVPPAMPPAAEAPLPATIPPARFGDVDLSVADPSHFTLDFDRYSESDWWQNLRLKALTDAPESGFETSLADGCWSPRFGHWTPGIAMRYRHFQSPGSDTRLTEQTAVLEYGNPVRRNRLERLRIAVANLDYDQEHADTTCSGSLLREELELVLRPGLTTRLSAKARADEDVQTGEISLEREFGPVRLGLWGGSDGDDVLGSLSIHGLIPLRYNLFLRLNNQPVVDWTPAVDAFDQVIRDVRTFPAPSLVPVDATLSLEYQGPLSAGIAYRFRLLPDTGILRRLDDSLLTTVERNGMRHDLILSAGFAYAAVVIENRTVCTIFPVDDEVLDRMPFVPGVDNLTTLTVTEGPWTARVTADYLTGRRDERDLAMDDALLIDLRGEYEVTPGFHVYAFILNLIDSGYAASTFAPVTHRSPGAGVRWRF